MVTWCFWLILLVFCAEMLRMRYTESPVGISNVRNMDLPGVLGGSSGPWGALIFRAVSHYGQVEGHRAREDDGKYARTL